MAFNTILVQGKSVLIRTVTMIDVGTIAGVTEDFIVLENAAWIGDTGRFADSLKSGKFAEVEPYPGLVWVARSSIVELCEIPAPGAGGYAQK